MLSKKQMLSELLEADLAAEDLAVLSLLQSADRAEEALKEIDQDALQSKIMAAVANINIDDIRAECADELSKIKKSAAKAATTKHIVWAQKNKNIE